MKKAKRMTAAELSRASDYSKASISRLTAEGILHRDRNGLYDALASLSKLKEHEATRQQDGKRPADPEIVKLRQQYLQCKIDRLQFDLDVERGKYVLAAEVEQDVVALCVCIKSTLLRLPQSIGAVLGLEAQKKADDIVVEVLLQLENAPLGNHAD